MLSRGGVTRDNSSCCVRVGHGLGGRKASDLIELRKREIIYKTPTAQGDRVIYTLTPSTAWMGYTDSVQSKNL